MKGGTFVEGDILVNEAKYMYTDKNFFWSLKNIAHLKKNSSDKIANLFVCLFGESFTHIRQNIKNN